MSKFTVHPQIQQLKAVAAGDIAFAAQSATVGTSNVVATQPFIFLSRSAAAAESTVALTATPAETPVLPAGTFLVNLSHNTNQSASLTAVDALVTLAATPAEAPTVGVGKAFQVV